ncbi:uncharacterized protein GGS25DRAFT_526461 [Hypoxylon fragiforme]|uniref:uncharacterized protein n=1 Tax=Hypoxylon fragiforme TaxID=63214 RepID=UPI0020C643B8|nr:uncharacterized protein GGS25DRAFT_526461 [Hypoxylon fragiforme]KAI2603428.1 hypothetical protein GGS25DRAFT_526461 [Hypoxylon fragiforme]
MSSITTSLPAGDIPQWCIIPALRRSSLFGLRCPQAYQPDAPTTTIAAADFQSICCNGVIVDTSLDLYTNSSSLPTQPGWSLSPDAPVRLADLICCGVSGTQSVALDFTPTPRTACAAGAQGTPLASLAATNASRALPYSVTYAPAPPSSSSDPSATVTNDLWGWPTPTYGASGTPVCFLANTAASGVSLAEVTVAATYVAPSSSSGSSGGGSSATETGSGPGSTATESSPSSPTNTGGAAVNAPRGSRLGLALGLLTLGFFLV